MIQSHTVYTAQIDDAAAAAREIVEAVSSNGFLKKNSVGIIHCHPGFIETGALKAVCRALPFETAGCATTIVAGRGFIDKMALSLTVLTSDDSEFRVSRAPGVDKDVSKIPVACAGLAGGQNGAPSFALAYVPNTFPPIVGAKTGDDILSAISRSLPGAAVYGCAPLGYEEDLSDAYVIYNGEADTRGLALLGVHNASPKFFIATRCAGEPLSRELIVTSAEANEARTINNQKASEFLTELGIDTSSIFELVGICFRFRGEDGRDVIRGCVGVTESGGVRFISDIPQNSRILVSVMDRGVIVESSVGAIKEAVAECAGRPLIIYDCHGRDAALSSGGTEVIDAVTAVIGDKSDFLVTTCGGEIYPDITAGGVRNELYNNSFIICAL